MGEQPVFTTKAHVFQIDPATKKNWIPSSNGAVNVSFYYDTNRSTFRIISVDGSKAVINSTVIPNMTFAKTSQKFGQWSDARANTVYGLGFSGEAELVKFAEKFAEIRELASSQSQPPVSPPIPAEDVNGVGKVTTNGFAIQNSEYMTPVLSRQNSAQVPGQAQPDSSMQLKYENDRLKIALAQSSQNAKKWEIELQTLKNNNARLTAALQESTNNVEEWKKQLAAYKEDNARLKKSLIEFEQSQPSQVQEMGKLQQELVGLASKLSLAENDKRAHQQELEQLRSKAMRVGPLEEINENQKKQLQDTQKENFEIRSKLNEAMADLERLRSSQSSERSLLRKVQDIIGQNISQLTTAQGHLDKLTNS